jgi:Fe-S-cluster-containing dehydrogenase component
MKIETVRKAPLYKISNTRYFRISAPNYGVGYLKRLVVVDANRCVGCNLCVYACTNRFGFVGVSKSAIAVRSAGGVERGFTVVVCRACEDPPCARACPVEALTLRSGGGVTLNPNKCIGCGFCASACDIGAIMWDQESMKPVICTHCGFCVSFCPHGVLALEEVA